MRLAWHSNEPPFRCSECNGWHQRVLIDWLPGRFLCPVFSIPAREVERTAAKERDL